jgi:hypothetical protein
MTDATGHMDRPGARPDSVNIVVDGLFTGYYTHPNRQTGKVEIVKSNPAGTLDEVIQDFSDLQSAQMWFLEEWRAGRLRP